MGIASAKMSKAGHGQLISGYGSHLYCRTETSTESKGIGYIQPKPRLSQIARWDYWSCFSSKYGLVHVHGDFLEYLQYWTQK